MSTLTEAQASALEPLLRALIAAAHREADDQIAAATAEAESLTTAARAAAEDALARARAAGGEDAAEEIRRATTTLHRERRAGVMGVRRRLYEETRDAAREAVRVLLTDPRTRAAVSARLEQAVGGRPTIRPHPDGGLIAQSPEGPRAIASVDALVDEALGRLDVDRLWSMP